MKTFKQFFLENVELYRKNSENNFDFIASVDDDYFNNTLIDYINTGSAETSDLKNKIKDRLQKVSKEFDESNIHTFLSFIKKYNLDLKEDYFNNCKNILLQVANDGESINVTDLISNGFKKEIGSSPSLHKAWNAKFKNTTGRQQAGSGELFLNFFCNGQKGSKGDIILDNFKIELKGNGLLLRSKDQTSINTSQKKYNDKEAIEALIKKDEQGKDVPNIDTLGYYIAIVSGTDPYVEHIDSLIKSDISILRNLTTAVTNYIHEDNEKRKKLSLTGVGSMFTQIGGYAQLYAYKKLHDFNSVVCFDKNLNLKGFTVPDNFIEGWNKISSFVSFGYNDTDGYSIKLKKL